MNRRCEQRKGQGDSVLCARYLDWVYGRREVALSLSRGGHHLPAENFRREYHPSKALNTEMKKLEELNEANRKERVRRRQLSVKRQK